VKFPFVILIIYMTWQHACKIKLNYFTDASLFLNIITQDPDPLVSSWHVLQLSWQKSGSSILIAVELVTFQVSLHWPKNNSPMGKVSTTGWIFFKLLAAQLWQLLVFVTYCVGLHHCAPLQQHWIQMPQPSSMLTHFTFCGSHRKRVLPLHSG
jgi:hypothetical protein